MEMPRGCPQSRSHRISPRLFLCAVLPLFSPSISRFPSFRHSFPLWTRIRILCMSRHSGYRPTRKRIQRSNILEKRSQGRYVTSRNWVVTVKMPRVLFLTYPSSFLSLSRHLPLSLSLSLDLLDRSIDAIQYCRLVNSYLHLLVFTYTFSRVTGSEKLTAWATNRGCANAKNEIRRNAPRIVAQRASHRVHSSSPKLHREWERRQINLGVSEWKSTLSISSLRNTRRWDVPSMWAMTISRRGGNLNTRFPPSVSRNLTADEHGSEKALGQFTQINSDRSCKISRILSRRVRSRARGRPCVWRTRFLLQRTTTPERHNHLFGASP